MSSAASVRLGVRSGQVFFGTAEVWSFADLGPHADLEMLARSETPPPTVGSARTPLQTDQSATNRRNQFGLAPDDPSFRIARGKILHREGLASWLDQHREDAATKATRLTFEDAG